jgi:hypothetical protein
MAAPLGNLISHDKALALKLFSERGLDFVATCIAPSGVLKNGQEALRIEIESSDGKTEYRFNSGELTVIPLRGLETNELTMIPHRLDLGHGRGKLVKKAVRGSELGIIVDTRGRPLERYLQPVKLQPLASSRREL